MRNRRLWHQMVSLVLVLSLPLASAFAQAVTYLRNAPYLDATRPINERVQDLLARMARDREKTPRQIRRIRKRLGM